MPIPHHNFYPPAGDTIDATDPRVQWNGTAWMLNGRVYGVPSSHRLIGRPGSALEGWYYDWGQQAWMQPSPVYPPNGGSSPHMMTATHPAAQHPSPVHHEQTHVHVHHQPHPHAIEKCDAEKKPSSVLETLVKHPVAPVLGGVLLLAAHFTDEPQPPTIPIDLPEPVAKQWQMIFNQNQQRFQRRMEMYENLGMVLLGYTEARAIFDLLPKKAAS